MRPTLLAAIALALLAPTAPAAAAPRLHGVPARVRGGSELRITWTGLGPEAHEAELELSLGGGRWVRISPELDAREGGFTWHVPSGLAGSARVRLAYGGEGFETEGGVSVLFVLEASATANHATEADLDEWWCLARRSAIPPGPLVTGAPSLQPRSVTFALSPEPDRTARLAASFVGRAPVRATDPYRREAIASRGNVSRSYPLRI